MEKIYRFTPQLHEMIWGGEKLAGLKGITGRNGNIGESWELSGVKDKETPVDGGDDDGMPLSQLIAKYKGALVGEKVYAAFGDTFPLLVKFIDARTNLSMQVHPDDRLARERHNSFGKTEMWYILDTEPGALIHSGLSRNISKDEYERLSRGDEIMDVVAHYRSKPGDVYFLPAGRVHAIGGGNLLAEIQQTSDITYRIYDYGRVGADGKPRELHVDLAKDAIDYNVLPDYRSDYDRAAQCATLVDCKYFNVKKVQVDGEYAIAAADDSFTIIVCVDGECDVTADGETKSVKAYETLLVAASAKNIVCKGKAQLLTAAI